MLNTNGQRHTREEITARRDQAWGLRIAGSNVRQIASVLKCSVGTAHRDLAIIDKEVNRRTAEMVEAARGVTLGRLDAALRALWPGLSRGDATVALRIVQIETLRARLLGLFAPMMTDLSTAGLARQMVEDFAERGEELDYELALQEAHRVLEEYRG